MPSRPLEAPYGSEYLTAGQDVTEMKDSVYVGGTHHGNVVHEQHIHNYPSQPTQVHTVVHHVHSVAPLPGTLQSDSPALVMPSKQIWFLGKRVWNPQGELIFFSYFCSFFLIWFVPVLPALAGVCIAAVAMKRGDLRAVMPLTVALLCSLISISLV